MPFPHAGKAPTVRKPHKLRGIGTILPIAERQVLMLIKQGNGKIIHISKINTVAGSYHNIGYRSPRLALIKRLRQKGYKIQT